MLPLHSHHCVRVREVSGLQVDLNEHMSEGSEGKSQEVIDLAILLRR